MSYTGRLKSHLAQYKAMRLDVHENGRWNRNGQQYAHILPQELHRLNILEPYRNAFWEAHGSRTSWTLHEDFHHLNSSQAMCFNLLFPFWLERERLPLLLELLGLQNGLITEAEFEKVLCDEEGTHFDFFLGMRGGGRILFELKLTERDFGKAESNTRRLKKLEAIYKPGLVAKIAERALQPQVFFENYQICRNVLHLRPDAGDRLVLLFPRLNSELQSGVAFLQEHLHKTMQASVQVVYLENVVAQLQQRLPNDAGHIRQHFDMFSEKYVIQPTE